MTAAALGPPFSCVRQDHFLLHARSLPARRAFVQCSVAKQPIFLGGGAVSSGSNERGGIRQWTFFAVLAGFVAFWVYILWRVIAGAHSI